MGRSSLSRIQFLAGEKPVSVTCACTPLMLPAGSRGLLIAGVDPIEKELLAVDAGEDELARTILPEGAEYLIASRRRMVVRRFARGAAAVAPRFDRCEPADGAVARIRATSACSVTRLRAHQPDESGVRAVRGGGGRMQHGAS